MCNVRDRNAFTNLPILFPDEEFLSLFTTDQNKHYCQFNLTETFNEHNIKIIYSTKSQLKKISPLRTHTMTTQAKPTNQTVAFEDVKEEQTVSVKYQMCRS